MKILVTGVNGQLGYDVAEELKKRNIEYLATGRNELDITDQSNVEKFIKKYNPDCVIHCAAYTAVDKAEDEIEQCRLVNAEATKYIAQACKEIDSKLLYISTDYVFEGKGTDEYEVDDRTNPLGIYGLTKLEGENFVRDILQKYFIVRISWVFGKNGNNFVKTMLRLGKDRDEINVVSDQIGSPTYTQDLAGLLCDMAISEKYGIYHATNESFCSWAEFAEEIFKVAKLNVKVNHIKTSEYPTKANRPENSRLSKKSLDQNGFKRLPDWKDAVKRYLENL